MYKFFHTSDTFIHNLSRHKVERVFQMPKLWTEVSMMGKGSVKNSEICKNINFAQNNS